MSCMNFTDVAKMIVHDEKRILDTLNHDAIQKYEYLQISCRNINVLLDQEFRRAFSSYYIMRYPKQEYREAFFMVFEKQKAHVNPSFAMIAEELYQIDGKHQFSFITKMLHTISDVHPIYDSQVAKALGITRIYMPFEKTLKQDQDILEYLKKTYDRIDRENLIDSTIALFDRKFPSSSLSFTKKIDFFLWAEGALRKASQ